MPKVGMEPIRRAEAINAALECFCECGIEKTTLDMVAQRAGFSKGIVAYYFKSKRQLILECMRAFMSSYQQKIGSTIKREMSPAEMVKVMIDVSLPPIGEGEGEPINVSVLDGVEKIRLPECKIASLFGQFLSMAASDEEVKGILREIYKADTQGISKVIEYAKAVYQKEQINEKEVSYTLLALVYGLSIFRIIGFMPPEKADNREIAFQYIDDLFGSDS